MPAPQRRLEDFASAAELEALAQPTGRAEGLPGACYGSAFYELEQQAYFPRVWAYAGVAADLPQPGDVLPVEIAGWPVLLVHDRNGVIRAFHNICRHRGMKVAPRPCSGATRLQCPYHGWTYGLDGHLLATPNLGGVGIAELDTFQRGELGLKPIRVGRWLDMLFVNIDGTAAGFDEHLAPVRDYLGGWDLASLVRGGSWRHHYPGNWKVSIEGGVEDYHMPWSHPGQLRGRRQLTSVMRLGGSCFVASESISVPDDGIGSKHGGALPLIGGMTAEQATTSYITFVLPTGLVLVTTTHAVIGGVVPDGPDRTLLDLHFYYPRETLSEEFAPRRAAIEANWRDLLVEDDELVRHVHANVAFRDAAGIRTRFSPAWEAAIHQFQKSLVETIRQA